jgi:hypothetical protein
LYVRISTMNNNNNNNNNILLPILGPQGATWKVNMTIGMQNKSQNKNRKKGCPIDRRTIKKKKLKNMYKINMICYKVTLCNVISNVMLKAYGHI